MNYKFILLIPLIEILLFILLGDFFGFFLVVFLIILTGAFGLILLRSNINLGEIKNLALEPNKWMYKKIAGILLIIPGFFTDLLGLILLLKQLRMLVWNLLVKKNKEHKRKSKDNEDIIEVEYRDLDDK
ncbi:MAG: FxsA family protein [Pseudomonadota bacterium]|nr:FxsA family protein [Pseudomonadota bacterium]